ncbi:MAG: hypothetical protein IPM53_32800 [Anaerolineaceae bacterium]|nr:hypothetical protein [Anaerolineaceae bacterium]
MDELTFNFGAKVHCVDDAYGSLGKVAINPDTLEVVGLIVENGLLLKRARVVPLSMVSAISEEGIYLTVSCEDATQLLEYRETKMERPADVAGQAVNLDTTYSTMPVVPMVTEIVREGISPELKVLSPHTAVQTTEGTVAKLHGVQAWVANKKVSGIMTRQGVLFPETGVVPIHEIERFGDDAVLLRSHQPVASTLNE